ncbi:hypothetical protein [Deinococcus navajonensis]|uniref:Lipoprotein n=1 Tax=Deinococcus navajonensis TaxID=309884 RepID=A0ABV8XKT2_9DEIO
MRNMLLAALTFALAACGQTDLAAPSGTPTLTSQGGMVRTPVSRTQEFILESPCTGEMITGTTDVNGERWVSTDASGGLHIHESLSFTGTYQGDAGTVFTESLRSRIVVNVSSSGRVSVTDLGTGHLTGSDGTKILDRGRFVLVIGADGEVIVERLNAGAICQKD